MKHEIIIRTMGIERGAKKSAKAVVESTETVWAEFKPLRGMERIGDANQVAASFDARFIIYYNDTISAKDEIEFEGRIWDIVDVVQIGYRDGTEILAKARNV